MILAFDTYYWENKAKTVCVAFEKWDDIAPSQIYLNTTEGINDYEPGNFYKRELPCILNLLKKIDVPIDCIVVDGFVYLDDNNKLGLGGYLFQTLNDKIPIIGVAKTNFSGIQSNKRELFRGSSKKALYITSVGVELQKACEYIQSMSGEFRIPTLLKELDRLTKEKNEED